MSLSSLISNFFNTFSRTLDQFRLDDNLISDEAKDILADKDARQELFNKLNDTNKTNNTKIEIHYKNKTIEYLVEH